MAGPSATTAPPALQAQAFRRVARACQSRSQAARRTRCSMISSCASHAENFSAPNVDTIAGVQIKRLPAGEAIGSHDLERWATRRSAGFSRSYTTKDERHKLRHWTKLPTTTQKPSHDGAAAAAARGILVQR